MSNRGFGVAAGLDPEVARPLAARCAEAGYTSIWSNDHPGAKGLETLAQFAAGAARIELEKALFSNVGTDLDAVVFSWFSRQIADLRRRVSALRVEEHAHRVASAQFDTPQRVSRKQHFDGAVLLERNPACVSRGLDDS